LPEVRGTINQVAAIRQVHKAINDKLGINKQERNKPSRREAEATMEELDAIGDVVGDRIRKAMKANWHGTDTRRSHSPVCGDGNPKKEMPPQSGQASHKRR
jgi:hypothetical protein